MTLQRVVDCRDVMAPWSSLRVESRMRSVQPGNLAQVLSVDPSDVGDLRAWCTRTGNRMLDAHSESGTYVILLQRTAS